MRDMKQAANAKGCCCIVRQCPARNAATSHRAMPFPFIPCAALLTRPLAADWFGLFIVPRFKNLPRFLPFLSQRMVERRKSALGFSDRVYRQAGIVATRNSVVLESNDEDNAPMLSVFWLSATIPEFFAR